MRRSSILALGAVLLFVLPVPATAQHASVGCQFIRGFKHLHDLAPDTVGACTSTRLFAANGDILQHTTNGLMVRRNADNWTAFTDGSTTYIDGPRGLVSRPNANRFRWEHDQDVPSPVPSGPGGRVGPQQAYPNAALTPGARDPRVQQRNVTRTICSADYLAKAQPAAPYIERVLRRKIVGYRFGSLTPAEYELDHYIPIELGGDPDAPSNIWPQPVGSGLGAHEKDRVESYLHQQVCSGSTTLDAAQQSILNDWVAVYRQLSADQGAS
jgi:hypothetical protein